MSDDNEYAIENTDAGASLEIPCEAGAVRLVGRKARAGVVCSMMIYLRIQVVV